MTSVGDICWGTLPRLGLGLACISAGWLLAATPVRAQERVKVTLVVILATDQNQEVAPRLACIAREVRKREPSLTGFRLDSEACQSLAVGSRFQFRLVEGQVAEVEVQHAADKENKVSLKVRPPLGGEIGYTSVCGKFLPIVTGYQTKSQERLIIAVRVQPCHKSSKEEKKEN
jgi:hypothetical protein